MNTLAALEFDRIRLALADYTVTAEGRSAVLTMEPEYEPETLKSLSRETGELLALLATNVAVPGVTVPEIEPVLNAARHEGAVLDLEELGAIRCFLLGAADFQRFFRGGEEQGIINADGDNTGGGDGSRSLRLTLPGELLPKLRALITPEGRLNEDAVPDLRDLRRTITGLNQDLQHQSEAIIRSRRELYRADRATVRDGRTVLPLAADFKGRVDGIIHESSGSGETLFVEPRELIDLNNRLAQTHNEVLRVIRRILREMTSRVREYLPRLKELRQELVVADGLVARARYGRQLEGCMVPFGDTIELRAARHPLLGSACVPLDIKYEKGVRLLVLSGPNTGGKTVLLKTLGLLVVMNQCGIPLPVDEGSSLPLYRWIGVDIGDEQSIEEALSTFSAHLKTLGHIARRSDSESLVLLDELGTGTDPEEGAALSMALIDHLLERGSTILVTTHQTILKHYGYTREGAVNAAMAFDEDSHRPTYRVIPGRPGVSYAIDTAGEQGIPPDIVARAREYHREHHNNVAGIISRLTEEETRILTVRREQEELQRSLLNERRLLDDERRDYEEKVNRLRREGLQELNRAIAEARSRVEREVRSIRERGETLERERIRDAHRAIEALERVRDEAEEGIASSMTPRREETGVRFTPEEGMDVRHRETGREGVVHRVSGNAVEVRFGAIRMTVQPDDLLPAAKQNDNPPRGVSSRGASSRGASDSDTAGRSIGSRPAAESSRRPALELDLRGYRVHEAIDALEKQLDAAILHDLFHFGVIHGTGTGAVQKGVQDYLRGRPEVAAFRFAVPEDGGFGKTVVELKHDSEVP
jgi:DNA mismatch repair protein MutS2